MHKDRPLTSVVFASHDHQVRMHTSDGPQRGGVLFYSVRVAAWWAVRCSFLGGQDQGNLVDGSLASAHHGLRQTHLRRLTQDSNINRTLLTLPSMQLCPAPGHPAVPQPLRPVPSARSGVPARRRRPPPRPDRQGRGCRELVGELGQWIDFVTMRRSQFWAGHVPDACRSRSSPLLDLDVRLQIVVQIRQHVQGRSRPSEADVSASSAATPAGPSSGGGEPLLLYFAALRSKT
jgi:hypothetical protein